MKIQINLASQPFRRDRPMIVASAVVSVLLAGTLIVLILLARADSEQYADLRKEIAALRGQIATFSKDQRDADAILRQPQNAEVLEASVFLNTLIHRKAISWTRTLADLEKVMPHNVKIMNIRPYVTGNKGEITLDMLVGADGPTPILAMYKALESSSLFGNVTPQQSSPPSQSEPLYRYRFTVNYAQKL